MKEILTMNKTFSKFARKFNIRLFDAPNYNVQTTASGDLSDEMKTYYSDYLIDLVEPHLVHDQFAQKKNIPKGSGKTIEFRKYSPLAKALTPLVEGVTPNGNKLSVSVITAEVYQYGDYITLSDILTLTGIDNNIVQATKILGSQAGRTLDTVTREVMAGGTNVLYAPDIKNADTEVIGRQFITSNNKFTADCAFQAKAILGGMNAVPIDESYVAIIHPYAAYDLMRDPEWIDVKKYDSDDYYKGEIGKIGGLRFVESTEAKIFCGDDLASDSRNLKVSSVADKTVTFTGGTVAADSLVGRMVIIESNVYEVASNTASTIVLTETPASGTVKANDIIYPGEGGAEGCAVFAVTVIGENAYASLENLDALKASGRSGAKDIIKDILKQSFTEGSEEVFTDISNAIGDQIINSDKSELSQRYEELISDGLSESEAHKQLAIEFAKQIGESYLGGALSGSVMGAGGVVYGNIQADSTYRSVGNELKKSGNAQAEINAGLAQDNTSKAYQAAAQLQSKLDNSISYDNDMKPIDYSSLSSRKLGRLAEYNAQEDARQLEKSAEVFEGDTAKSYVYAYGDNGYNGNVYDYNKGFNAVYMAQQQGKSINEAYDIALDEGSHITPIQATIAYDAAKNDTAVAEFKDALSSPIKIGATVVAKSVDKEQQSTISFINEMAKTAGVEVVIPARMQDVGLKDANGAYVNGKIVLPLDNESKMMNIYLGHEMFHHFKINAPESADFLQNTIIEKLKADGSYKYNERLEKIINDYGFEGTREQQVAAAHEEMAANACFTVFSNEANVKQLVAQDRTLAQKVRDFFAGLIDRMKKAIAVISNNAEYRAFSDEESMQEIVDLFDNCLKETQKNNTATNDSVKYALKEYSEKQIENWKDSKSIVVYENTEQLRAFCETALNDNTFKKKLYFGAVTEDMAVKIKQLTGLDTENLNCCIRADEIRKILRNSHGNEKSENLRGQRAITIDDIVSIPDIIQNADEIRRSKTDYEGKPVIEFVKNIDGKTTVISYVSKKHNDLTVQTMYASVKGKKNRSLATTPSGDNSFSHTSKTLSGITSTDNVPQSETSVNSNDMQDKGKYSLKEGDLQKEIDDIQKQIISLRTKITDLKNSDEYNRMVSNISTSYGVALDNALSEYGKWLNDSGLNDAIRNLDELQKKDKKMRQKISDKNNNIDISKDVTDLSADEINEYINKAEKYFGTTTDYRLAGYLTVNGKMLDFSDGQRTRVQDHREINDVLDFLGDDANFSDGLINFMNMGNIRLNSYGIDIAKQPNNNQISVLKKIFDKLKGEVTIDFSNSNGDNVANVDYIKGTSSEKIISDINYFYKNGALPEQSVVSQFHTKFSLKEDSEGNPLSDEQIKRYKNIAPELRDEKGRIKPFYHGTSRADRVGNYFNPDRATSGPMAYFTDNEKIADNYSKNKSDTSLAYDDEYDSYETQFRVDDKSITEYWYTLSPSEKRELTQKIQQVTLDDDDNIVLKSDNQYGIGNFNDYELNMARGNALQVLVDGWLNGGTLWGDEYRFIDVLNAIGIKNAEYKNPDYREEKVYKVYLNITNPFNTDNVDEEFISDLEDYVGATDMSVYDAENAQADMWDKNSIDIYDWIERLKDDFANGTTHAWTSIPDVVTDFLKEYGGHNGIIDRGGKQGGEIHTVAIPFYSNQIKNVDNINPTDNEDIRYSKKESIDVDEFDESGYDIINTTGKKGYAHFKSEVMTWDSDKYLDKIRLARIDDKFYIYKMVSNDSRDIWIYKPKSQQSKNQIKEMREYYAARNYKGSIDTVEIVRNKRRYSNGNNELFRGQREKSRNNDKLNNNQVRGEGNSNRRGITQDDSNDYLQERRYSIKENPIDYNVVIEENAELSEMNEDLKEMLRLTSAQNEKLKNEFKITDRHNISNNAVDKVAAALRKQYSSSYDKTSLVSRLAAMYDYMANAGKDIDSAYIWLRANDIAKNIIANSQQKDTAVYDEYKELRNRIRNTAIRVPQTVQDNFADYNAFRRENFGRLRLSKEGIELDAFYNELSAQYPEFFDTDVSEEQQLEALANFFEVTSPVYYSASEQNAESMGMNMEQYANLIAGDIIDKYFDVPEVLTAAEKHKKEMDTLKLHYRNQIDDMRQSYKYRYDERLREVRAENAKRVTKLRADKADALAKQKAHFEDVSQRGKERRKKSQLRNSIRKSLNKIARLGATPDKKKHIPNSIIDSVKSLADVVNFDDTKQDNRLKERLNAFQDSFEMAEKDNQYSVISELYNDFIHSKLSDLKEEIGNTPLKELPVSTLEKMDELFKMTVQSINNINRLFLKDRNETIEKYAENISNELAPYKKEKMYKGMSKSLMYNSMKPEYFFQYLGSDTLLELYHELRKGEDVWAVDISEARDYALKVRKKYGWQKWDNKHSQSFNTSYGKIELTLQERLAVYANSLGEHTKNHLYGGGFRYQKSEQKGLKKLRKQVNDNENHRLSESDVALIVSSLDERRSDCTYSDQ